MYKRNNESLFLGIIPVMLVSCNGGSMKDKLTDKPNVIFVLVDDMGYGDLSCFGQKGFTTPVLDRMASEGIRFNNFYCGSTVSAPSRASLLTGKHTGHTSVRGNTPEQLTGDDEITIAKVMKQADYKTACIGKWGIGHPPPSDDPYRKGFDYFYGYINMWHAHNLYPEFLYRNGEKVFLNNKLQTAGGKNPWQESPEGTGVSEVRNDYAPYLFDQEAISFIERNKDDNFFLYLAYNIPHANNEKRPDGMEVPDYYEFAENDWPIQEKGFASMMRNIDNSMGMIFTKLKNLGIDDKTLVIFCGDNGPHQEGGHNMEFFNSNGNWRGMKRDMYEGGIRTPFIARWPGVIKPNTASDHIAAFWDILPTFCDIAGVKKPEDSDGISFLPAMVGRKQSKTHDYLYWEFFEQGGKQAILKGDWKAIRLNVSGNAEQQVTELYNLKSDPAETKNVAGENPVLIKQFNKLFISARTEFKVTPLFSDENNKADTPVAQKPPMGWNSFDAFDCRINEDQFKKTVDFMAENLLQFGWNYAVIDYIWWHPSPGDWKNPKMRFGHPNIRYEPDGKPLDPTTIDEYGRLLPAVERFPSSAGGKGFKPIADYVHSKGMKFGIHIMRGIHRDAYYNRLPVKETQFNARDIADIQDTCKWCNHMYGVNPSKPGAQEYYNSLFELYASWGIDFVKVDDIAAPDYHKGEVELIRNAIKKCGRPIVLSLSPGEAPLEMAEHLTANANMWRISADFWDDWDKLKHNFKLLEEWAPYQKAGSWADADMLPVGRLSIDGRPHGPERNSNFTWPEHYTLLTLWSISRSPMIIGADLLNSPDSTLFFLTNPEVIAVNQNSTSNKSLYTNENESIWIAEDPETGGKFIALFNLRDSASTVSFNFRSTGFQGKIKIRDLWKRKDLGVFDETYSTILQPHGAGLFKLEKSL